MLIKNNIYKIKKDSRELIEKHIHSYKLALYLGVPIVFVFASYLFYEIFESYRPAGHIVIILALLWFLPVMFFIYAPLRAINKTNKIICEYKETDDELYFKSYNGQEEFLNIKNVNKENENMLWFKKYRDTTVIKDSSNKQYYYIYDFISDDNYSPAGAGL